MPEKSPFPFHRQYGEPAATAAMILLLVVTGAITLRNLRRLWNDSVEVGRSYDVINAVDAMGYTLAEWDDRRRALIATGQRDQWIPYRGTETGLENQFKRLETITADVAIYDRLVDQTATLVRQLIDESQQRFDPARGVLEQTVPERDERLADLKGELESSLSALRSTARTNAAFQQEEAVASYELARYTTLISTLAGLALVGGVMLAVYRRRVEAERDAALVDRESKLRQSTLDALAKYVIVCDQSGRIVTANEVLLRLFGLERDAVVGQPLSEVAGGQWNLDELVELMRVVQQTGGSQTEAEAEAICRFASPDKRVLKLRARQFSADSHGEPLTLLILSDITQQRELEARNRQLDKHLQWFLEQIHDYAIFMIDTEFRATTWNSGVLQVLGYDEHEFLGRDIRPLIFTPESHLAGTVQPEFDLAVRDGSSSDDRWMMRKDGTQFWASGITTSVRDDDGNLVGYSKVMRDMTLQKQNSDEMSRLAAELSEESRRKNEFLATLAHELRNPLSPIKTAVQLMGMMDLGNELDELRATMARQVEQMVRLIEDLSDVSRIGHGKIELKRQVVEIKSLVDAAIESSQALIRDNHQQIEVVIDDPSICVDVDPARITQVITNLLNNASKYSDVQCRIRLITGRQGDDVVIRVVDNGNGIAPERIEDIFEMFSQTGDSIERGSAGLGIGLMLVRTLVELHGGTVQAHSEGIGRGSEFVVRLPTVTESPPESSGQASDQPRPMRAYRILVVEDMRALATILARLLIKLGQEVRVVDSGMAAIEKLAVYPADIIFSDISMPGMSGYELAQRLKRSPETSHIRLVAMTGYGQASDREKALHAGFDEHMVKPVDIRALQRFLVELAAADAASADG